MLTNWLIFDLAPGLKTKTVTRLLAHYGSAAAILAASARDLTRRRLRADTIRTLHQPDQAAINNALTWLTDCEHHHIIPLADPRYPELLKTITDPPLILYVHGDPACLIKAQIALVGSRNASNSGTEFAFQLSCDLANCGLTITSGLARGIDGASHRGALSQHKPTIAVLGSGLQRIYPYAHTELAQQVAADGGAVVSELPLQAGPHARHFPRRNRIISGLSLGTVVIEATMNSGSLITARTAMEQGREVFAVPGAVQNALAKGCHYLLREGAKLVESVDDITEELPHWVTLEPHSVKNMSNKNSDKSKLEPLATDQQKLLECVDFATTPMEQIVVRSGLTAQQTSSMLLDLELRGYVSKVAGGFWREKV